MAEYFTTNDLRARLNKTACWIYEEAQCVADTLSYTGKIHDKTMLNLSLVVAFLEAAECYSPITSEAEDGVINCLTEAEVENIFKNISAITGLCFVPKCVDYIIEIEDDNNQLSNVGDKDGIAVKDSKGKDIKKATTQREEAYALPKRQEMNLKGFLE
jgi:hypothetical protein